VSPSGVMLHFNYHVFHLTRRQSWDFAFQWGANRTSYIKHIVMVRAATNWYFRGGQNDATCCST